jgi:pilus assembly protein FimV
MRHRPLFQLKRCAVVVLAMAAAAAVTATRAAELGELQVRSYIGQPLVADVELVSIAPDELTSLHVRLASPDVYRIANVAMDPALLTLNLSIMRREQRQFLHITSIRPVDANHAVLFLELSGAGRSIVREATAWLSPDPNPHPAAPPPAPPDTPSPALIAAMARADMTRTAPPPAPAHAPTSHPLMSHVPPPEAEQTAQFAGAAPAAHPAPVLHVAPAPVHAVAPAVKPAPVAVATPAPAVSAADRQAYAELGRKNAALSKKLGELEGKLQQLQRQVGVHPAGVNAVNLPEAAAPSEAAPVQKAKPKPLPLKLKLLKALPQKKAEPAGAGPWPWIAGGVIVLLAAAGGWWLVSRSRQPRPPSKYWVLLKKPFRREKKAEEDKPGIVVMGPVEEAVSE